MTTLTMKRINTLSAKRAKLYHIATNGGGANVRQRIKAVTAELDKLWDQRRSERVGKLEGIDLLVERSYARLYGSDFPVAALPSASEPKRKASTLAA